MSSQDADSLPGLTKDCLGLLRTEGLTLEALERAVQRQRGRLNRLSALLLVTRRSRSPLRETGKKI